MKGQGVLPTVTGWVVGGATATLVAVQAFLPAATDAPNGWWHDPQGWLVLLVPPIGILGALAGTWTALRLTGHTRRIRTIAWAASLMLTAGLLTWISGALHAPGVFVPQLAAVAGARLLAARA